MTACPYCRGTGTGTITFGCGTTWVCRCQPKPKTPRGARPAADAHDARRQFVSEGRHD